MLERFTRHVREPPLKEAPISGRIQSGDCINQGEPRGRSMPERCSRSRVRFTAPNCDAPSTPARRSGQTLIATGGSCGHTTIDGCTKTKTPTSLLRRKAGLIQENLSGSHRGCPARSISEDKRQSELRGAGSADLIQRIEGFCHRWSMAVVGGRARSGGRTFESCRARQNQSFTEAWGQLLILWSPPRRPVVTHEWHAPTDQPCIMFGGPVRRCSRCASGSDYHFGWIAILERIGIFLSENAL